MRFIDACQTCPNFQRYQMNNPHATIVMALTQDQQEVTLYTCTKDHTQPMMAIPVHNCSNPVFPQLDPPPNCIRLQEQTQHPIPHNIPTPQPDQSLTLYIYTDPKIFHQPGQNADESGKSTPAEQQQEDQNTPDNMDHTETADPTPPVCLAVDFPST